MAEELISEWDRRRYVPKPGEPELPPQLADLAQKSTEQIMSELNRMPFFMTELDETDGEGGENTGLEALKSLAYDGEPDEIATNFKNQGNDCYKTKQFKNAVDYYTRGLEVDCGVDAITAALYLNRAACNLELKNYRRCIEDCKKVLMLDEKSVKACFRAAKAFFAVERYDEAKQILDYGLRIEPENESLKSILSSILEKERKIEEEKNRKKREQELKEMKKFILLNAIKLRHISMVKSSKPADLLEDAKIRLENETDHESQLIFPAMILYPTTDEFDYIAEISELTTPQEILEMVMNRPKEWFDDIKHQNFSAKNLVCFMETESGGLVKVGKKVAINTAMMNESPKAPLFDNSLRLYLVPKDDVQDWVSKWNKDAALARRKN